MKRKRKKKKEKTKSNLKQTQKQLKLEDNAPVEEAPPVEEVPPPLVTVNSKPELKSNQVFDLDDLLPDPPPQKPVTEKSKAKISTPVTNNEVKPQPKSGNEMVMIERNKNKKKRRETRRERY